MAFGDDRHRVVKALELLENVIGPAIHAKSMEEEAETIARLVVDRDDLEELTMILLGMITALMDVVTVSAGYEKSCDYYHYVVSTHKEELAKYN